MRRCFVLGFWVCCGVVFCLSGLCVCGETVGDRKVQTRRLVKIYRVVFKGGEGGEQRAKGKVRQKKVVKKTEARKEKRRLWGSARVGKWPRLMSNRFRKREYAGAWRRPLLDKRMVAGRQFGVGNFNRVWDEQLRIVHDGHGGRLSGERAWGLYGRSWLSSKGWQGLSVGGHGRRGRGGVQDARWSNQRLGRITVYWARGRGTDWYTRRLQSATGVRLMRGHCAVDPRVIPYGSVVRVHGVGDFWAVDTGRAVRERQAARRLGRSREEQEAIVVDLFFPTRSEALEMTRRIPRFTMVSWRALPKQ